MISSPPWLTGLFGDPEVSGLWSSETQLDHYRAFEAALALALEASGRLPPGQGQAAAEAIGKAELNLTSLADGTLRDGLPIPDLVRQLRIAARPNEVAVHTGATSQDVLDTALALTLRSLSDILLMRLESLDERLADLASRHGDNPLMGRTRMQAALPITVLDRVENWQRPIRCHADTVKALRPKVERLQLGGAVGTRGGLSADAEQIVRRMSDALGLFAGPVWHTDRTAIAEYAGTLSVITGSLGKIGQDIALMSQQGIDEIALASGGGSSAMPHKSNPVLAELLITLARYNATQVAGIHQALVHEQERSGSAWMLEWIILPPMTVITARALSAACDLLDSVTHLGRRPSPSP